MKSLDHRKSPRTNTRKGLTIHSPQHLQREGQYTAHQRSPQTPQRMTIQSPHSLGSPAHTHCTSPRQHRTSTKRTPVDSSTTLKQPEALEASISGTFVSSLLTICTNDCWLSIELSQNLSDLSLTMVITFQKLLLLLVLSS